MTKLDFYVTSIILLMIAIMSKESGGVIVSGIYGLLCLVTYIAGVFTKQ